MKPLLIAIGLLALISFVTTIGCKKDSTCYHCVVIANGDDTVLCGSIPNTVTGCVKN